MYVNFLKPVFFNLKNCIIRNVITVFYAVCVVTVHGVTFCKGWREVFELKSDKTCIAVYNSKLFESVKKCMYYVRVIVVINNRMQHEELFFICM